MLQNNACLMRYAMCVLLPRRNYYSAFVPGKKQTQRMSRKRSRPAVDCRFLQASGAILLMHCAKLQQNKQKSRQTNPSATDFCRRVWITAASPLDDPMKLLFDAHLWISEPLRRHREFHRDLARGPVISERDFCLFVCCRCLTSPSLHTFCVND